LAWWLIYEHVQILLLSCFFCCFFHELLLCELLKLCLLSYLWRCLTSDWKSVTNYGEMLLKFPVLAVEESGQNINAILSMQICPEMPQIRIVHSFYCTWFSVFFSDFSEKLNFLTKFENFEFFGTPNTWEGDQNLKKGLLWSILKYTLKYTYLLNRYSLVLMKMAYEEVLER
jgi:hypothetical protein